MKSPLSSKRAEVAAVALDGKLHALGGAVDRKSVPDHDEYDPVADAWRMRAQLPEARDHLAVTSAYGKIYAFGGFATPVHKDASDKAFAYGRFRLLVLRSCIIGCTEEDSGTPLD
jgi:N-acetylneuraminic acid mutarotase